MQRSWGGRKEVKAAGLRLGERDLDYWREAAAIIPPTMLLSLTRALAQILAKFPSRPQCDVSIIKTINEQNEQNAANPLARCSLKG